MTRKNTEPIGATPCLFVSAVTFIGLLFAFLFWTLTATHAAPKWKQEVGIASWCYNLDVMKALIKAEMDGNPEVAFLLFKKAIKNGDCLRLPVPAAAFRPSEVVEEFTPPTGGDFSIVKGNVIKKDNSIGKEAYVLVFSKDLQKWQADDASKFPMQGPEFGGGTMKAPHGWQNI